MSFTEVTRVSWFSRMRNSVVGVLFGLLLVVLMVAGLFWNEGRAVQTARSLAEGAGVVVAVAPDIIDLANNGKLVHVTGKVTTSSQPTDPVFGISVDGVRLVRTVEMYQWRQKSSSRTSEKLGGSQETTTTYSYIKQWSERAIDSHNFKVVDGHSNPPMAIESARFQVPDGKLGAFTLDDGVLSKIGGERMLPLRPDQAPAIQAAYGGTKTVTVAGGRIYLGHSPDAPAIGDYRVTYAMAPLGVISVVARQHDGGLEAYQTQAGDRLLMVDSGSTPADEMFSDAERANTGLTWLLRILGLLALWLGFSLIMRPISVLASIIPFLGGLVRIGTRLTGFLLAVLVGGATIAIAWFWYRPLLSIVIVAIAAAIAYGVLRFGKNRADAKEESSPTPAAHGGGAG